MCMRHVPEEQLVDFALGNISKEKREAVEKHINNCDYCRQEFHTWNRLLTKNDDLQSSIRLNERVMDAIDVRSDRKKRKVNRKVTYFVASAAIILIGLGLFQSQQPQPIAQYSADEYITSRHEHIPEQPFMSDPATSRLNVVPVTMNRNISGDVWLNEVTNELILQVDGLEPLPTQDYQLWLVHDDQGWKDEILRLEDGRVQVYYKGPNVKTIRFIKVSVEPIGGSDLPTGPETLFIDLQQ